MKIAVIGRGNVGGGLADLWERAGHEVSRIGKEGGDVSDVDAVLVAVPGGTIAEALDTVQGLEGKKNGYRRDKPRGRGAPRGLLLQRRIREVEDQRSYGEVVQRQLRRALRPDWRGGLEAEQFVERRRGGAAGRRAAQPRSGLRACLRRSSGERRSAGELPQAHLGDRPGGDGPIPVSDGAP